MKLITKELERRLLENGRRPDEDHRPVVKFFDPCGAATWLIAQMDPEEPDILFGLADLGFGCPELGSVRLSELQGVKGPLGPGDTVVEVGCGTGLNFDLLQKAVGPNGKIVGINISEGMLERARALVRDRGWQNVELVSGSVSDFEFPEGVGGIIAMGVLTYEPEFDKVIERGAKALSPGRRWVVLDYKMPRGWQRMFAPLFIALGSSFGVSKDLMKRHIWEAVERHLKNTKMQELYGGFVYIVSGEAH